MKAIARWLRGLAFKPGNPANVAEFMGQMPPRIIEKGPTAKELEFCSQHYYSHLMHALEVVGYCHPDRATAEHARTLVADMCSLMHLPVEAPEDFAARLGTLKWPGGGQPNDFDEASERAAPQRRRARAGREVARMVPARWWRLRRMASRRSERVMTAATFRTHDHADGTSTATVDGVPDLVGKGRNAWEAIGQLVCYERAGLFAVHGDSDPERDARGEHLIEPNDGVRVQAARTEGDAEARVRALALRDAAEIARRVHERAAGMFENDFTEKLKYLRLNEGQLADLKHHAARLVEWMGDYIAEALEDEARLVEGRAAYLRETSIAALKANP